MIVVIVVREEISGKMQEVVSHGIDYMTMAELALPPVHPSQIGAVFRYDLGEYVLEDTE